MAKGSKKLLIILILALIYFVSAKLGLKLAFVNASATVVWPPTGIAIASFLIFGNKIWPAIFLGAFFANVTTAGTILTSLGIAVGYWSKDKYTSSEIVEMIKKYLHH